MSLLTTSAVRARAQRIVNSSGKQASLLLENCMEKQASAGSHTIFLSHAFSDRNLILGVALTLEDLGYSVYLDWRDDPTLDRQNVNAVTAAKLRERMRNAQCLFYATTENASSSRWMPWELGFKDGQNNRTAILPIKDTVPTDFRGQEYLGIYPYVTQEQNTRGEEKLWVRRSSAYYVVFEEWLNGTEPHDRH
ncbi:hypothetical protein FACS1894108_14910 [Planctomycetales bacterium]|nr:hypothetical protein FACS1894108_14910 [Planctomycetales bacterium]